MDAALIIGWTAVVAGTTLGLPQVIRLLRTRNIDGISVTTWQVALALNIGWLAHGIRIAKANMIAVNLLSFLSTAVVLTILAQEKKRPLALIALPGILTAAAMISVDQWLGPAVFGIFAALPAAAGQLTQSRELVSAERVDGVSGAFLALTFTNFSLWAIWGGLAGDMSSLIASAVAATLALFNLVWLPLRLFGVLGPLPRTAGVGEFPAALDASRQPCEEPSR